MTKLDNLFVCIGAQKAGTSWLHNTLYLDERLSFCPFVKEIHYFDYLYKESPLLNNWRSRFFLNLAQGRVEQLSPLFSAWLSGKSNDIRITSNAIPKGKLLRKRMHYLINEINDDWYIELLKCHKKQDISVDITPDYAVIGETGFKHMLNIADNFKGLFILRNPVERAWSGLLQGKKKTEGGIEGFMHKYGNNIDWLFDRCTSGKDVGARNNYLLTLIDLENSGMLKTTKLGFYDEISEHPENFIMKLYEHLELSIVDNEMIFSQLHKRINETKRTEIPEELAVRLKEFYHPMLKSIDNSFIQIPKGWW